MPYEIRKVGDNLYKVCKKDKTKCFSKKGISKGKAIKQMKAIGMRGGAVGEYGSWDGDLKSWQDAGFPGCGLGMEYDPNGECYEGCAEKEEPFSCIAKSEAQKRRGDITKYSNNASVRTAIQDEDAMKRFLSIEIRKEDEDKAKKEVASAWEVPPVPKWDDIREIKDWNEVSNNYTGFVKMVVSSDGYDPKNPLTYNIAYYKNGKLVTYGLKPGAELKYKFDWDKIKQRWERIHPDSIFNPTNFATDRKNRVNIKGDNISGKFINFDSRGAEKFEAGYHGSLEYLNSVEGRHIREADPYFEELYLKLLEQNHGWEGRNEKEKKKFEADLEKDFIKEEKERYGNNKDIFSPEKNFTLKDRNGRSLRVNKVRLRKDGGYDIQFSNGTWEYQPGKDEWDCNEWKRGERLEDYGVCGTEGRKRASELKEKNINRERDQIWDGMSGWDKFVNGLAVAGAYTTDNIMPIASTVLSFVPGIGSTLSTIIDTAKNANDTILNLMGNPCRHFNECTERDIEAGKANSLYHRTKGDTVAENYLTDENWQKLLDDNEEVHPLIMDTINYGSRAGKFVQTGSGKKSKELMDLLQNEIYTEFNPTKKVKKLNDLSLKFPEIGLTKELINEFKDRPYMIDKALLDIVMDLQKSGNGKPTNKKLYDEIKKEVYKKNKKHSLYRSALIQKIYKSKGGEYLEGKKKMNIDKWFNQKWISINDYLRGEIVQCGNSNTQEKYNEYPLCRPLKIAELMTKDEMKKLIAKKNKLKSKPVITEKVLGTKKLNIKPTMSGLGKKKLNLLELFKGTGSVGKVAKKDFNVISLDLDPISTPDIETDILKWDYKKFYEDTKFLPNFIWASPPCNTFSKLAYPLKERNTETAEPLSERAKLGSQILHKTLEIIDYFKKLNPNLLFVIENPIGMMRKDKKIKKLMLNTTYYCLYEDKRQKHTDFFSNFDLDLEKPRKCPNKTVKVVNLPLNERYKIPPKLIKHIFNQFFKYTKLKGGSSKFNFDKDKYLRIAKSTAKKAGYNPKLLKFSTNPKKKLNYNGVDFGASGYGDFIIYKLTDPKIADKKRENYRKRAKKVMSETNDKFSPASLSYYILW